MTVVLNERLLEKQGIDEEGAQRIIALHEKRENMFDLMRALDPEDPQQRISLREWAEKVEELEFELQDAWGFPQTRDMHSWWYRLPHCKCPIMDNMDVMGTDLRYFNGDCPIHGQDTWEDNG
mgnify:FL=1